MTAKTNSENLTPIRAYFSHSYRPEDKYRNLFFWEFFRQENFRFAVDKKPDSPTPMYIPYIEWLMRQSACFVAVIPRRPNSKFYQVSHYQVFESELASLAHKPRLLFVEKGLPGHLFHGQDDEICYFDSQWYQSENQKAEFREKSQILIKKANAHVPKIGPIRSVGLLFRPVGAYSDKIISALKQVAKRNNFPSIETIDPAYEYSTAALFSMEIEKFEILISEIREPYVPIDVLARIQDRCIPTIRICHLDDQNPAEVEKHLHLSYMLRDEPWKSEHQGWPKLLAGYQLDEEMQPVIFWKTEDELIDKVGAQLAKIQHGVESLEDNIEAKQYFLSFGRRKEKIFISNHNGVNELAKKVYEKLRWEEGVDAFHYTDLDSIEIGTPDWLKKIYSHIESSKIFLIILSPGYMDSENCLVELKRAKEIYQNRRLRIFPYKAVDMEWPTEAFWRIQGKDLAAIPTDEEKAQIIVNQVLEYLEKPEDTGFIVPTHDSDYKEFNIAYLASKKRIGKFSKIRDGEPKDLEDRDAQYTFEVLDLVRKLGGTSEKWAKVIDALSDDLYSQVFKAHPEYWDVFLDEYRDRGYSGRKYRFCFATDDDGINVPFEWMRTSEKGKPICLDHPVRRFLLNKPNPRLPLREIEGEKINFLLVSSNTGDIPRVNDEIEEIEMLLKKLGVREENICTLNTEKATYQHIKDQITSKKFQFLHFAAHGGDENDGRAFLQIYEDFELGVTKKIFAAELRDWIEQSDLRFVYLSSCLGAEAHTLASNQAEPVFKFNSLRSMIQAIVESKVPEVIGFHWPILDKSSYEFAKYFYKSFIECFDSSLALYEARHRMSGYNEQIWAAPILIQQF
jgi:hypothetical protein